MAFLFISIYYVVRWNRIWKISIDLSSLVCSWFTNRLLTIIHVQHGQCSTECTLSVKGANLFTNAQVHLKRLCFACHFRLVLPAGNVFAYLICCTWNVFSPLATIMKKRRPVHLAWNYHWPRRVPGIPAPLTEGATNLLLSPVNGGSNDLYHIITQNGTTLIRTLRWHQCSCFGCLLWT